MMLDQHSGSIGQRQTVKGHGALTALTGAVFCLLAVLMGQNFFCPTTGCAVTAEIKLLGFSLWWYGVAGFMLIGVLSTMGWYGSAFFAATLGVLIDIVLLLWMAFGLPCFSCLVAGAFFPVTFWLIRKGMRRKGSLSKIVLLIWLICFAPNMFGIVQEIVGPWPVYGQNKAGVRVFYSPTCPACRNSVTFFLPHLNQPGKNIAFYPILRSDGDLERVETLYSSLKEGKDAATAFAESFEATYRPSLTWKERIEIRIGLFRNKVFFHRSGGNEVPLVLIVGAAAPGAYPETK